MSKSLGNKGFLTKSNAYGRNRRRYRLVELRGNEPLSESNLEGTSPGAVCYLHSLILAGTNTLQDLVAS